MAQRHMDRLTSFDTSFLTNEKSNGHMAIGAIMVCEGAAAQLRGLRHPHPQPPPPAAAPAPAARLPAAAPGHARSGSTTPTSTSTSTCSGSTLPAPGTDAQFHELVGEYLSPPLDRSKPLWELWLVDGFEDDRFGIIYKTHHAMADGISAVDIGMLLFDVEPKHEIVRDRGALGAARRRPRAPGSLGLARAAGFVGDVRRARCAGSGTRREGPAQGLASAPPTASSASGRSTWNLTKPAPKVAVQLRHRPRRAASPGRPARLDDFKQIKNALGGTVNDVTLAVAAAPCGAGCEDRDVEADGLELQALVPVSVRTENEHGELGNRLTAMRGPLPVGIADPVERLRYVTTRDGGAEGLQAAARRGSDLGPQRLVPRVRAAAAARPDRGDQLLDPALQHAGHQLPRPAGPLLRARPRADRGLPDRLPRQEPRAGDRDLQLQRPRCTSACSPTATRLADLERDRPRYLDDVGRGAARAAAPDSLPRRWRRAGRRSSTSGAREPASAGRRAEAAERAPRRLPPPAREPLEEPPGADRGDLGEPLRPHRRRDLGAARGGADPRRRRRADHRQGGRAARAGGRGGRGPGRRRGGPRAADRDPRRGRLDRAGADRPQRRAGGAADGRRQRHRQDDDDRQDRLAPLARSSASR